MSTQMQTKTQDALSRVFGLIREIVEKSTNGNYIYRGEPEHYEEYDGKVSSTLYRMAPDGFDSGEFNLENTQKSTLEDAKRYTHERTKEDFELLTELQHYGSETNLIDFNYHIALFFACDGSHDKDGRVILLQRNEEIDKKYRVKQPWKPLSRVLAQKSIFVQPPNGFIHPNDLIAVSVPADLKQWILIHLRKFQDISTESIYNDLHGFIKHKDRRSSREAILPLVFADITVKNVETENQADEEQRQQLQSAIRHYTSNLQYASYDTTTYVKQGRCYILLKKFDYAIETLDKAILLKPNYDEAYLYRGFTYNFIGEYALAVKDFTRVIELIPDNANAYSKRGFAFLHMKDWENAKTDLITAGDIGLNIIALFRQEFGSIADFEQKTGIQLPSDITALLTPP